MNKLKEIEFKTTNVESFIEVCLTLKISYLDIMNYLRTEHNG